MRAGSFFRNFALYRKKKPPKRLKGSRPDIFHNHIKMKHFFRVTLTLALAAVALASCKNATFINPSESEVQFAKEGGDRQITVSSDGTWSVADCLEWINAEVNDSVLTLKAGQNDSGAPRECELKLVGGDVNAVIAVRQADHCTRLSVSSSEVSFGKEGGSKSVDVDTDGSDIKVEVKPEGGVTAQYAAGKLEVTAPANDGGAKRGTITLTCDTLKAELTFAVEGNICPTCKGSGKVRCSKCGGKGYYTTSSGGAPERYGCSSCGGRGSDYYETMIDVRDWVGNMKRGSGQMS